MLRIDIAAFYRVLTLQERSLLTKFRTQKVKVPRVA
jgi:hypothetical protein